MNKFLGLLLITTSLCAILSGCSESVTSTFVEPSSTNVESPSNKIEKDLTKYEKAASLYVEVLWRDLTDSDNEVLHVCDEALSKKIQENAAIAVEARRKSEYYSKKELCEMLNLNEDGEEEIPFDDMIAPQFAGFSEPIILEEPEESVSLVSKDEYHVTRVSSTSGLVTLDNGTQVSVPISPEYSGKIEITLIEDNLEEEGEIVYKASFDNQTIYLFLDIENEKIVRIREKLSA